MPGSEAVSTLHRPKNDILAFFKFLQKKVSWLNKNAPVLFCIVLGVVIWKTHVAKPLDSSVQEFFFLKLGNFFLQKFEK